MHANPFSAAEIDQRLRALRNELALLRLDGAIIASPENIFYLTGLDHWGYFAPHMLIVPAAGEMVLFTRAMERVTVTNHVLTAPFEGHSDSEPPADVAGRILPDPAPPLHRIGIEAWSA